MPRTALPRLVLIAALLSLLASCAPQSADPRSTPPERTASSTPTAEPGLPDQGSGLPPAASGFRWTSMLDVAVQVPAAWGYDRALGQDWCANRGESPSPSKQAPFVGLHRVPGLMLAILCPDPYPPEQLQVEHLEWGLAQPSDKAGESTHFGWVYSRRVVGAALLTYVHRPDQDADSILATARQVAVDPFGCPVSAQLRDDARPTPAAAAGDPTGATVCQYAHVGDRPNLIASAQLTAEKAAELSAAIESSPVMGGPVVAPSSECLPTGDGLDVGRVVVRFAGPGAAREVWLTVGNCRLATLDDGVTFRRPTREACIGVFTTPIWRPTWDGPDGTLCGQH